MSCLFGQGWKYDDLMKTLVAMFCLGVYTLLAQMLVTRELAVLCLGNELTISIVFSVWLVAIGFGAWLGGQIPFSTSSHPGPQRICGPRGAEVRSAPSSGGALARVMPGLFLWLALGLPLVMLLVRAGAGWTRGSAGEYMSLSGVFAMAVAALAPLCVPAGLLFPLACRRVALEHSQADGALPGPAPAIGSVYALEGLGSLLGGALFSFWLCGRLAPLSTTALGMALACLGAAFCAPSLRLTRWAGVAAGGLLVLAAWPGALEEAEWTTTEWRWRGVGLLIPGTATEPGMALRVSRDTRYQNLALFENRGQHSLYGDGQSLFSFPDEIAAEHAMHFVMAQCPGARRILVLGGNPMEDLPQLLKYPVERIEQVELDEGIIRLLRDCEPETAAALDADRRVRWIHEDGPGYLKRTPATYDLVLVRAPEPVTGTFNRYYTREFYADARRALVPGGVLYTSLEGSERLEGDALRVPAAVHATLRAVFPEVRVTAGTPLHFFAANGARPDGTRALTADRQALFERSRAAGLETRYFRPEYFLSADEWEPAKMALTEALLAPPGARVASLNTVAHPVSYYHAVILWSHFSGSGTETVLRLLGRLEAWMLYAAVGGGGVVLWVWLRRRRRRGLDADRPMAGIGLACLGGACVALELVLIYAFQCLYGYVYAAIGVMVGIFMFGAVLGAAAGRRGAGDSRDRVRRAAGRCVLGALLIALLIPGFMAAGVATGPWWVYGAIGLVGLALGAGFVLQARLLELTGMPVGRVAALADAVDYGGSAVGGLVAGLICIPVLGITATCLVLALGLGVAGLLLLFP